MAQIKNQNGPGVAAEGIEAALRQHWAASAAGNQDLEHEIYDEQVICDYPQSGERIHGRRNLQNLRSHHPGKPAGFSIRRLFGSGKLWITEYTITQKPAHKYPQRRNDPKSSVLGEKGAKFGRGNGRSLDRPRRCSSVAAPLWGMLPPYA